MNIKPREIFDIAAAAHHNRDSIIGALKKDDVAKTLSAIEWLKPDFVNATIAELAIKDTFKPIIGTALSEATELLKSIC